MPQSKEELERLQRQLDDLYSLDRASSLERQQTIDKILRGRPAPSAPMPEPPELPGYAEGEKRPTEHLTEEDKRRLGGQLAEDDWRQQAGEGKRHDALKDALGRARWVDRFRPRTRGI